MKVLLTGLPRTGKTTLLQQTIPLVANAFWVICQEIRDQLGQRVGFEAHTSTGLTGLLAHKQAITSTSTIGDYRVDLSAIDQLLTQPIQAAWRAGQVLIIDEIGRMQMLSSAFEQVIHDLFESSADFIATIRYGDDWTEQYTSRPDVITLELTPDNRAEAAAVLEAIIQAQALVQRLTQTQQHAVMKLSHAYGTAGQFIQLKKLYHHAVRYVVENRVDQINPTTFHIKGDHDRHTTLKRAGRWSCDCDLFNGRNQFAGQPGECSHIQAAKLLSL